MVENVKYRLKEGLKNRIIIIVSLLVLIGVTYKAYQRVQDRYDIRECTVIRYNYDITFVRDEDDDNYMLRGVKLDIGDKIKAEFDNKNTEDKQDDIIKKWEVIKK